MKPSAERINLRISQIIADALSGDEPRYRTKTKYGSYTAWGLVEREIHLTVIAEIGNPGVNLDGI